MSFECSECQVVLECEHTPFVCPNCGLAGVLFCPIDEAAVRELVREQEGAPLEVEINFLSGTRPPVRVSR